MTEIQLTRGMVAIIDDEDVPLVSQYKWQASLEGGKWWYATHGVNGSKDIRMHRLIMDAPDDLYVDHRNGNGLDNRRSNLRVASNSQNQANRVNLSLNTSGFRGVTFNKSVNRWQAQIKCNRKNFYLGIFPTAEEAARAYDTKAKELFGGFARLNFPESKGLAA